jgi:hypothetical protein
LLYHLPHTPCVDYGFACVSLKETSIERKIVNKGLPVIFKYRKIIPSAWVLLGLFWLSIPVTAGDIRHDRPDSSYTNLAAQPQFNAVGHTDFFSFCGCTLVAPNWVLTAGHVGANVEVKLGTGTYSFVDANNPLYNVAAPGWNGDVLNGHDFRLMKITGNPIADGNATVMPLYQGPLIDQVITNVGYGYTGNGVSGYIGAVGTRRAGNMMLRSYLFPGTTDFNNPASYSRTVTTGIMLSDFINPDTGYSFLRDINGLTPVATAQDLEYMLGPIDSGSPALINDNGVWKIAGVASFILTQNDAPNPQGIYGDVSGFSILDEATIQWINAVTAVPEPNSIAFLSLIVCGGAGGGWYQYRRQRHAREQVLHG